VCTDHTASEDWRFAVEQLLLTYLFVGKVATLVTEYSAPLSLSPWLFRARDILLDFFPVAVPHTPPVLYGFTPPLAVGVTDLIVAYADVPHQRIVDHMTELLTPSRNFPAGSSLQSLREQFATVLYRHVQFFIPSAAFPLALWARGCIFPDVLPDNLHVGQHFFEFFRAIERHRFDVPDLPEFVIRAEVEFLACHKLTPAAYECVQALWD
jgi:hypothetical protein